MQKDCAETGNLQKLLSQIGTGLDQYLKFEHLDALNPGYQWRKYLDIALPQQGVGIDQVTEELVKQVIPNGSAVSKPGLVRLSLRVQQVQPLGCYRGKHCFTSALWPYCFNFLEELSLQWLATMFGVSNMQGVYSSGGSVANLLALGAARQFAFEKIGYDVAANGIDRPVCVYASAEAHHTIQRSAGVLGIGRCAVRSIPCDSNGRMRVDELQQAIARDKQLGVLPIAIVANAGTTNTGAIDPLQAIGEIAKEIQFGFMWTVHMVYREF